MNKVDVLIDGKVVGVATKGLHRPDVFQAYPDYGEWYSGYEYQLDTKTLTNGNHQIVIRETSDKGVQNSLAARTVKVSNIVQPPKGDLNSPSSNQTVSGTIPVYGWFLDGNGVNKIEVLIDGQVKGVATKGLPRPDVLAAYPLYADGNSGYEYQLDIKTLTNGNHQLVVRETSNKGVQTSLPARTIKVANAAILPAKGDLNSPSNNQTVSGIFHVYGWFLDGNGVNKIEVLIDGQVKGAAIKGLSRPDVLAAYPSYADGSSGYEYQLDTKTLTNGNHQIIIRETSSKNVQTSLTARTVKVSNAAALPAMGDLNGPARNQTLSGIAPVWGWFVDGNGVAKIEVLVDGSVVGTANKDLSRPDVLAAYPAYANGSSGYAYMLNTMQLSNGNHQIVIRETSAKNVQTSLPARTIAVNNPATLPAMGDLNEPANGATLSGNVTVRGWFVDGAQVDKIEILIDGAVVGTAQLGLSRPDVLAVYPQYENGGSGYLYTLDTTTLGNGAHQVVIRETSKTGVQTSLGVRTVTIAN